MSLLPIIDQFISFHGKKEMEWMARLSTRLHIWNIQKQCQISEHAYYFIVTRRSDHIFRIAPWYSMDHLQLHPLITGIRGTLYLIQDDHSSILKINTFYRTVDDLFQAMDRFLFPSPPYLDELMCYTPISVVRPSLFHMLFFYLSTMDLFIIRTRYLIDTNRPRVGFSSRTANSRTGGWSDQPSSDKTCHMATNTYPPQIGRIEDQNDRIGDIDRGPD